jgi:two-component system, chemotaxis family, response regulator Rcp1
MTSRLYDILLVEDNIDDVVLILRAFRGLKGTYPCSLRVAENGVQALDFLQQEASQTSPHLPDLILLNLKLPKKDGGEVLRAIKADGRLRHIPVVVLTSSALDVDVLNAYRQSANAYVQKPTVESFAQIIHQISDYWLSTATLPPQSAYSA